MIRPRSETDRCQNLRAYYQDEYILGFDKQLASSWSVGAKLTYRTLHSIIDNTRDSRPFEAYALAHGITLTNPAYLYDPANPGASKTPIG
jgi:hypothetical protein